MEDFILHLKSLDPLLIYLAVFSIALIENIFPPSPSDTVIVFAGSLVGIQQVGFVESLFAATLGSAIGFVAMYKFGDWFGVRILKQGRIKFIPIESVRKVELWFGKYGYGIIIANRFLAGTRAVVSFFAGMSRLNLPKTIVLSFLSALAWNSILLFGGFYLGQNWQKIGFYMNTYSQIVTSVIILVVLVLVARFLYMKNGKKST